MLFKKKKNLLVSLSQQNRGASKYIIGFVCNHCRAQTHNAGPGFCWQFGPVLLCASKLTVVD